VKTKKNKTLHFFRKYHKWLGLIFAVFLVIYSLSGIILNHRSLLAGVDVSRDLMPERYTYNNWNMGALRGGQQIGPDSILMYGNMGIYLANTHLEDLEDYTQGLPLGMDNKKVYSIYKTQKGNLYMGSLKGAFYRDFTDNIWVKIALDSEDERIVDISEQNGKIVLLSRSYVFISDDDPMNLQFTKILPKNPANYDNKVGLFKTTWLIHSGEIYGHTGKLIVDLVGIIFILLSIGGIVYFFMPKKIKKDYKDGKSVEKTKGFHKWNLRWHNRLGYWSIVFLLITTITGIFLRPPGLLVIASSKVAKIPYTKVDTPSAWFDKLRAIHYDDVSHEYYLLTDERAYRVDTLFKNQPQLFKVQPPISIMGVTVFEKVAEDSFLVGSFAGLFLWQPLQGFIYDYQHQKAYENVVTFGPPIKNSAITGWLRNQEGEDFYIDYDIGLSAIVPSYKSPKMPQIVKHSPISLWNYALEIHTGRFFSFLFGIFYIFIVPIVGFGIFYIFIVPIVGFATIFILVSGFVVWWKRFR